MVVGSFASSYHGLPRTTQDLDVVIDPTPAQLGMLLSLLPEDEYYVSPEAAQDALRRRGQFNVIDLARRGRWDAMRRRIQAWNWNLGHLIGTMRRRQAVQRGRKISDLELRRMMVPGSGAPRLAAALPNYREAYEQSLDYERLRPDVTMGIDDVGMLGLGWYDVESVDGVLCRWCCGYAIAFLRAPAAHGAGILELKWWGQHQTDVVILVGHRNAGRYRVTPKQWQELRVPVSFDRETVRVDLVIDDPFIPSDLEARARDHRTLGVLVARISIAPA